MPAYSASVILLVESFIDDSTGEMFDLEKLSEECLKHRRYSFFVSSMPVNIPGGVGSPPNAVAIF
jgi:hypothetical protein